MNILLEEKEFVKSYVKSKDKNWLNLSVAALAYKDKNVIDSAEYRNKANELYNSKNHHNEDIHEELWSLYSKSIAFAPKNSEDLALCYENRSGLLFHLKKFEDCIKDCDRALEITSSYNLKAKLYCRKAESLMLLEDPSVNKICEQYLALIEKMLLASSVKKEYRQKLKSILTKKTKTTPQSIKKSPVKNHSSSRENQLINFSSQKEVPCASDSVAVEYNKEWGRHIVAVKKIKAGEIISVEKNFMTQSCLDGQYLFCSHCFKYVYSSIPCENCVFEIYCSKECQQEALYQYHYLECLIYPYFWKVNDKSKLSLYLKFFLRAIHKAGSLKNMVNYLVDIENCKDPREKGFTNDAFKNEDAKSFLSLSSKVKLTDHAKKVFVERSCLVIFLLAKNTYFFREKKILSKLDFMRDDEFLVATALFFNLMLKLQCYGYTLKISSKEEYDDGSGDFRPSSRNNIKTYGVSVGVFSGLFNHSCDPNVGRFVTKDNTTVIYAKNLIKKGSQLFLSYFGEKVDHQFLALPVRQASLLRNYGFVCTCPPCKEDWPCYRNSLNRLIQTNPEKFEKVMEELKEIEASLQNALGFWKFKIPRECYHTF